MGLARRAVVVFVVAGVMSLCAGLASADQRGTDVPIHPLGGRAGATSTTTVPRRRATTTTAAGRATSTRAKRRRRRAATTTTTSATTSTSDPTTTATTTTAPPSADAIAAGPSLFLRGLCATTNPQSFVFALSNLGTARVDVQLLLNGAPFDTVTLDPGQLIGFRTSQPGTVKAVVGGVAVAETESVNLPCPISPGEIALGSLCRDPAVGYHWLVGSAGTTPVDVEVRLEGVVVGTFAVEAGGIVGFTTKTGGHAEAFVGGKKVADAVSTEVPCNPPPAQISGQCFAPGQGYRWGILNETEAPITVEFVLNGASQGPIQLAPHETKDVTTAVGGNAQLLLGGAVVAAGTSVNVVCDSPIFLSPLCSDAASGAVWELDNGSDKAVVVRLVLDGADAGTVTLAPVEVRDVTTARGKRLDVFQGSLLMAEADSASNPCTEVAPVCLAPAEGHVWDIHAVQPAHAELRIGGVSVGFFDLAPDQPAQLASQQGGSAQLYVNGVLVSEASPSNDPCVELHGDCFDAAHGFLFAVFNLRDVPARAEVRMNGASLGVFDLAPFGLAQAVSPAAGTAQLYLNGVLASEAQSSNEPCEPAVGIDFFCREGSSAVEWGIFGSRAFTVETQLRFNGRPLGRLTLHDGEGTSITTPVGGVMQAIVNGVVVNEVRSDCPPAAVGPAHLPATGSGGLLLVVGVVSIAAGLVLLEITRRPRRRTS